MFSRKLRWILSAILLPTSLSIAQSRTLRIAAAADLQPVLPQLVSHFEKRSETKITVSYASSATLATQILNGAPYDLFLAANMAFPQKVVDANLAIEPAPITYARGSLVLWMRYGIRRTPPDLQSLKDPFVHRIAVANPTHAPYGAAAIEALRSLGMLPALQSKLVFAENVAQAATFGQSGNAECALISLTLAITPVMRKAGEFVALPKGSYRPLEQGAVSLRRTTHVRAVQDFLAYLQSPAARSLLGAGGLQPPSSAK